MSTSTKRQACFRTLSSLKTNPPIPQQHRQITNTTSHANEPPSTTPLTRPQPIIPPGSLSYHWDTPPPTASQLSHAAHFFQKQPPTFLWSAEKFKTMDYGTSPEVCFLGRSNVGKSSLLNALLGRKIAHTSSKPGRTRLMNAFAVGGGGSGSKEGDKYDGGGRLVVLDMPGYGKGGRAEWGKQILKYVQQRKQLKRAFLLVDAEHGLKDSDRLILNLFRLHAVPYQVILSKADRVLFHGSRMPGPAALEARLALLRRQMEMVRDVVLLPGGVEEEEGHGGAMGEVIACSGEKWVEGRKMGIDAVRFCHVEGRGVRAPAAGSSG